MQKPVVRLEGVTYTYAGSAEPALEQISLTVQPGEFIAITGPSGCGKSTLSFCLTGFIPQSFYGTMQGRALIGGHDTGSISPGELAGIAGLVQQDPEAQLCTLHVAEEVAFGPENLGLPAAEIEERLDWALEAAGIAALKKRSLHTLSGGEKQRVAIASVLAMQPRLLILDEPTANLDPRGCREVLAVVERLRRDHKAAIIIFEHRLQHLLPLADRLIVMERGRIAADGLPAEVAQSRRLRAPFYSLESRAVILPPAACRNRGAEAEPGCPEKLNRPGGENEPAEAEPPGEGRVPLGNVCEMPLLSVEGLTAGYGQQPALKEVTFSLYPGETAALMGDNGCGKSTLLLALLGILKPVSGRICFSGRELTGEKVALRAREMGLTFQNPNHQLFEKTVFKEAGLPAQFLSVEDEGSLARVEQLLLHFDLERYRERLPFALSLGEKKRLTLVSVLAYRPRILLLDEPLVGQDQDRLDLLLEALSEHNRHGGVAIMACHDPAVVEACCTRVLFLEQGELLIDAPTDRAFAELSRLGKADYLPLLSSTGGTAPG